MADKQTAPDQADPDPQRAETPVRIEEDYRLLCRRYSRLRSRLKG
jgi:hypothetical protein